MKNNQYEKNRTHSTTHKRNKKEWLQVCEEIHNVSRNKNKPNQSKEMQFLPCILS